jgi:hypothetical protein
MKTEFVEPDHKALLAFDVDRARRILDGEEGEEKRDDFLARFVNACAELSGERLSVAPNTLWSASIEYTPEGGAKVRFKSIGESEWRK